MNDKLMTEALSKALEEVGEKTDYIEIKDDTIIIKVRKHENQNI